MVSASMITPREVETPTWRWHWLHLLQARDEAGVEHVFLFPAHDLAGGYDMPEGPLRALAVKRARL